MQLPKTPGCKQPGVSLSIHAEANVPEQTFGQQPHPVGAELCSAHASDEIRTSGRSRAPPLQNVPHGFPS